MWIAQDSVSTPLRTLTLALGVPICTVRGRRSPGAGSASPACGLRKPLALKDLWAYHWRQGCPPGAAGNELRTSNAEHRTSNRLTIQFPTRVYTQIIDAFLTYAELAAENDQEKQEAISYARDFGQQLLAIQIKEGPYRGLTQSHAESWGSKYMLQPDRGGIAGTSLLKLYAVTKEAKFLNAAVEIADAFKSTQLPDGRWVYRAKAKTGIVTDDYTSDQTEQILFLDRLVNEHGRQDFAACRDKAVQWMLENPAKTMLWPNSYEDTGTLKGP